MLRRVFYFSKGCGAFSGSDPDSVPGVLRSVASPVPECEGDRGHPRLWFGRCEGNRGHLPFCAAPTGLDTSSSSCPHAEARG